MEQDEIIKILLKRVDVKGILIEDILKGVIYKKIDELVASSENSLDNAVAEMVKPLLSTELEKLVVEFLAKYEA